MYVPAKVSIFIEIQKNYLFQKNWHKKLPCKKKDSLQGNYRVLWGCDYYLRASFTASLGTIFSSNT